MKESNALPSQEFLKECIEYDPNTGECFWKDNATVRKMFNSHANRFINQSCRFIHNNSVKIRINKIEYFLANILVKLIEDIDDCLIMYNDGVN